MPLCTWSPFLSSQLPYKPDFKVRKIKVPITRKVLNKTQLSLYWLCVCLFVCFQELRISQILAAMNELWVSPKFGHLRWGIILLQIAAALFGEEK